jgi:hypothetical protein
VWYCLLLGGLLCVGAYAQAQNTAAISQGFQTNEPDISPGAVVSLEVENQGRVQLANTSRVDKLVGVVGDRPLIALSNSTSETQVVTSGITQALVSNINGEVKAGDKITASPINGVGMKATTSTQVVGTSQEDFGNIQTKEFSITDRDGKSQVVRSGLLPIQVNVTYYIPPEDKQASFLPPFLRQIANSIAGKEVPVLRVLVSLLVLLLGFVSTGVILYSSVQSSIISIGRNPLSEGAIHKSLLQVGGTSIGILLVMVITIYLILAT